MNSQSPILFITWYTYAFSGQNAGVAGQRWFTASRRYDAGTRVGIMNIWETTGGVFDQSNPAAKTVDVGIGTIEFSSCTAAIFTYSFYAGSMVNKAGTINLTRVGPVPPGCEAPERSLTLKMSGIWRLYTSDQQTLLASYALNDTAIHGVNGYWINGPNLKPYPGFPADIDGAQAGYNTSTSQFYIIDESAEDGFVWEFDFPSATRPISGCRYRYPTGSGNKGACVSFVGF